MQKDNFLHEQGLSRNKLRLIYFATNRVKGPKEPNSAKNAKKLHKVPRCAKKNATKNRECVTLLTFSTKQRKILQRFYLRQDFFTQTLFARSYDFASLITTFLGRKSCFLVHLKSRKVMFKKLRLQESYAFSSHCSQVFFTSSEPF